MFAIAFGFTNVCNGGTISIVVFGKGGLTSDGTRHKVCPDKDPAECARIGLPSTSLHETGSLVVVNEDNTETTYTIDGVETESILHDGENQLEGSEVSFHIIN